MSVSDLETMVAGGHALTRAQAERVLASGDLASIGLLGESARKARSGDLVTFGRVAGIDESATLASVGDAGELRLTGRPVSIEDARQRTRAGAALANGLPLTGFSLIDLVALAGGDPTALTALAVSLRADGLEAVSEVPVDRFSRTDELLQAVRAVVHAGLGAWRATVDRAAIQERLDLIERVQQLQQATGALRAFAPLPRLDPPDAPSTGYDDVRTIAVARLLTVDVPVIQVDWPLYGPKLAQVAIAFGAGDIDGVAAVDTPALGPRRASRADIERQIRAAAAVPAERNGRYELRS